MRLTYVDLRVIATYDLMFDLLLPPESLPGVQVG